MILCLIDNGVYGLLELEIGKPVGNPLAAGHTFSPKNDV
jgi:hypothetical protein